MAKDHSYGFVIVIFVEKMCGYGIESVIQDSAQWRGQYLADVIEEYGSRCL